MWIVARTKSGNGWIPTSVGIRSLPAPAATAPTLIAGHQYWVVMHDAIPNSSMVWIGNNQDISAPRADLVLGQFNDAWRTGQATAGAFRVFGTPKESVSYSITGGADAGLFDINNATGALSFKSAPDYEGQHGNSYAVQITADDSHGGTKALDMSIQVTPVNDNSPVFTTSASVNVVENSTAVETVVATDADLPAQTITYSLVGGADQSLFALTSGGVLTFVSAPNREAPADANGDNLYEVQILADDGDGGTTLQDITVQVTNVNESPVGLSLSANTIGEILPAGTAIGQFTSHDPDTADSFTYSLISGDTASFQIVGNELRSAVVFDFEVKNSYTVTVQTTDADGLSFTKTFAITILDRFGAPPVLTLPVAAVSYTENTAALPMNATAVAADVDSPNFDGGQLTAALASNAQPLDRLRVRNQGTTAGLIGVTGATVTYGGVVLGTISGGIADNSPLVVTLNTTATPAAVAALLKNITFDNVGDDPTALTRVIRFTLTDGDGENSLPVERQVKVVPVNDAPVVATSSGTVIYTENANAEIIDSQIVITDIDSPDFQTGSLKISITTGILSTNRLTIVSEGTGAGQIAISGVDVLYGGVSIGTFAGGFTTSGALTINFNNPSLPATPAMVQALARRIGFTNTSDNPTAAPRTISFVVNDGDGKSSVAATRQVAIQERNDAPVIATTVGTATYKENAVPVVVYASGTVTDVDSTNLDTGTLTVEISSGADAADRLQIKNVGVAAGQIGVTGNVITYGGVAIGTFTGGVTDNSPLVVTLNASANAAAVSALVKAVAFSVAGDVPVGGIRVIRSVVTDGDGGTSLPSLRNLTVVAVNDAPQVVTSAGTASYIENAASAPIDAGMVITDVDSSDFAAGTFKATLTGGVTTDRLTILPEGGSVGQIDLVGTTVRYGGVAIGTYAGGFTTSGPLTITFNASSSPAAAQALARRIGFHNTGDNPTAATRTVSFVLTDGDGGTSVVSTKQIVVTPINGAPTIGSFGADVTHTEGGAATTLAATATVVDVDSTNFNGGLLVVSLVAGGTVDDLLAITNQGTTAGKIGVAGTDVTYGGIVIGSFAGGAGGTALTVTFNSSATTAAVQALVRTITYKLTGTITTNGQRRVRFSLTDDLGAASLDLEKNINLINT